MEKLYAACVIFLISLHAQSQYYFFDDAWYESEFCWEAGIAAGGINCLTDLGGSSGPGRKFINDVNWNATRVSGSVFGALHYRNYLAVRASVFFGEVNGADSILKDKGSGAYGRYLRNLHFRSPITEASIVLEYYPLLKNYFWNDNVSNSFSPYVAAGIGYFSFHPQASSGSNWINLPMLRTEGQGMADYPGRPVYKLKQWNIPLGLGLRYQPSPIVNGRFEIMYRKLWTDYLDDVSTTYIDPVQFHRFFSPQIARLAVHLADRSITSARQAHEPGSIRGNPKNNDTYFSVMLHLSIILGRQRR